MDIGKDNSKGEGIVKFVEGFGARTNPFGDNRVGERAYRRAERISAALFLLTSHVSDTEPLRLKVRATAVGILDDVLALRAEMRSLNSERIVQLKSSVRELISLTRILAVAGYVSTQNAAVVAEALDELSSFLAASQRSPLSESASFNREDFLDVREPAPPRATNRDASQEKDIKEVTETKSNVESVRNESKQNVVDKGHLVSVKSGRAKVIIEVLRSGGAMGIRDVASNLPEFSEKMIQRELAVLVQEGLVVKQGEKRWSRYSLK
jgi:predicted transcriptional regulator